MGIYAVKPAFQRTLHPVQNILIERGVHPDAITLGALAISGATGLALSQVASEPRWLLLAPATAIARTALNALDGLVAKATGKARPWGEVLNEFSDRLADVALLGGLALSGLADVRLGAAAIVAVLLASYLGTVSKAAGASRQYGGVMGKADRMMLLAVAAPLAYLTDAERVITGFFAIVIGGSLITIVQRGVKTHAEL